MFISTFLYLLCVIISYLSLFKYLRVVCDCYKQQYTGSSILYNPHIYKICNNARYKGYVTLTSLTCLNAKKSKTKKPSDLLRALRISNEESERAAVANYRVNLEQAERKLLNSVVVLQLIKLENKLCVVHFVSQLVLFLTINTIAKWKMTVLFA